MAPPSRSPHRPTPSRRRMSHKSSSQNLRKQTSAKYPQPTNIRRSRPRQRRTSSSPGVDRDHFSFSSSHISDDDLDLDASEVERDPYPILSARASDPQMNSLSNSRAFRAPSPQREMPLAYASLPPTPISSSPPPPHSFLQEVLHSTPSLPPFSLWDYLREELLATDFDSHQELKWERVSNFLAIPVAMEKVIVNSLGPPQVQCSYMFITDHGLWLCSLPRLLPLHVHHTSYSLCVCLMARTHQSRLTLKGTTPAFTKG